MFLIKLQKWLKVSLIGGLGWAMLAVTMLSFSLEFPCQFIDVLYGKQNILIINNEQWTMIEDTEVNDAHFCNNNSDCDDIKLEPYEIYDQVSFETCGKVFVKSLTSS